MPLSAYNDLIVLKSKVYSLDKYLIGAIILVESSAIPYMTHFEPQWRYQFGVKEFAEQLSVTVETERNGQATSWGLMQVMGTVARELGFRGLFPELCLPSVGIDYGCRHLKSFFEKYYEMDSVIAAYNAGTPKLTKGGMFYNQTYVDNVMRNYRKLDSQNSF